MRPAPSRTALWIVSYLIERKNIETTDLDHHFQRKQHREQIVGNGKKPTLLYKRSTQRETLKILLSYHIISYHIVVLKRQNRLKVGTDKSKPKVKMQSVSDDDVRKRLLEQPRFELAAKGVFRLGSIFWQGVLSFWCKSTTKFTTKDSAVNGMMCSSDR